MLPLLPALILLLLNGPANIERMAAHGSLPAALAAIQQRADAPRNGQLSGATAEQYALASLLSLTGDPQVSRALAQIFSLQVACEVLPSAQPQAAAEADSSGEPPPIARSIGKPHRGFLHSQRSRDGPFSC